MYVLMREYSGINRLSPLFITHLAFRSFLPIINYIYARTYSTVKLYRVVTKSNAYITRTAGSIKLVFKNVLLIIQVVIIT